MGDRLDGAPSPADILTAAAQLVELGWTQGRYFLLPDEDSDAPTAFCAVGAVEQAAFNLIGWAMDPRKNVALGHLRATVPLSVSIAIWNDDAGRTQAEVVQALRKAAREARGLNHED